MKQRVWRLAAAGNAAALLLLLCVLSNRSVLFGSGTDPAPLGEYWVKPAPESAAAVEAAARVLVIVVDALRVDFAADAQRMPHLARLASQGGSGIALLEALVPSTVAAIQTLVSGTIPPPASFLQDFRARRASTGGLFGALAAHAWPSFVAGPRLWTDLYGAWISEAVVTDRGGAGDALILHASLQALAQPEYRLLVVHFGGPDDAGHQYGVRSQAYAQAVAWCDAAIGQLWAHAGARTAILVTADHGVTENGGHAGPEPIVRHAPLITWGPGLPHGALGTIRQRDLPQLVLRAGGLIAPEAVPPSLAPSRLLGSMALFMLLSLPCGLRLWTALARDASGRVESTLLNATLWVALLLGGFGYARAAIGLITLVLLGTTFRLPGKIPGRVICALGGGGLFGALRFADGLLSSQALPGSTSAWLAQWGGSIVLCGATLVLAQPLLGWPHTFCRQVTGWTRSVIRAWAHHTRRWLLSSAMMAVAAFLCGGLPLLGVYLLLLFLGTGLGEVLRVRRAAAIIVGMQCALWPAALTRWLGESASLSTVDVQAAFDVVYGMLGVPAAVVVVAVRHAVPMVGVLLGLAPVLARSGCRVTGGVANGLATLLTAQALLAMGLFAAYGTQPVLGSLALGMWLRVASELVYSFLTATLLLLLLSPRAAA